MTESPRVGAFAIVPSNDLPTAIPFWERLGFNRTGGAGNYIIMTGWGCEVHLTKAGAGPGACRRRTTRLGFSSARPTSTPSPRGWTT